LEFFKKEGSKKNTFLLDPNFTENPFLSHNVSDGLQKVKRKILSFKIENTERKVF